MVLECRLILHVAFTTYFIVHGGIIEKASPHGERATCQSCVSLESHANGSSLSNISVLRVPSLPRDFPPEARSAIVAG